MQPKPIHINQSCLFNFLSFNEELGNDLSSEFFVSAFSDVALVVFSGLLVVVVVSSLLEIKHELGNVGISLSVNPSISRAQKEKNSLQKQSVLKGTKMKSK